MRWYVALKKKFIAENQNLDWDALKNEMLKKYDSSPSHRIFANRNTELAVQREFS